MHDNNRTTAAYDSDCSVNTHGPDLAEIYEDDEEYGADENKEERHDDVLDYVLEDSIVECLGQVLSVCMESERKEGVTEDDLNNVMMQGNQIYNTLHRLCLDNRELFISIYTAAKEFKKQGGPDTEHLMLYRDAMEQAAKHGESKLLFRATEFIHSFRSLVKQRLTLVSPLLRNPQETSEVFDALLRFMCYECIFKDTFLECAPKDLT